VISRLKVLEEENVDIIVGLPDTEQVYESFSIHLFYYVNNIARSTGKRRFTLHIVSIKPKPLYIEELRQFIQNNIVYTVVIRYYGCDLEKIKEYVEELKKNNPHIYGFVYHDFKELSNLLRSLDLEVEEV